MLKRITLFYSIFLVIQSLYIATNTFAENKVVVIPIKSNVRAPAPAAAYNHNGLVDVEVGENEINSVDITVSLPGTIIANATVNLVTQEVDQIGCGIYATPTFQEEYANYYRPDLSGVGRGVIANVRHFNVDPGTHTIHYICYVDLAFIGGKAFKSDLSILFIPSP